MLGTHWLMSSRSISAGSIRSMYGRASIPSRPGWIPQSSWTTTHTRFYTLRWLKAEYRAADGIKNRPESLVPWTPGWCRTVPPPVLLLWTQTHRDSITFMSNWHPDVSGFSLKDKTLPPRTVNKLNSAIKPSTTNNNRRTSWCISAPRGTSSRTPFKN